MRCQMKVKSNFNKEIFSKNKTLENIEIFKEYNKAFRKLFNDKVFTLPDKPNITEDIKKALKLTKNEDWNFLATAPFIIDDTNDAFENFIKWGFNGVTKLEDRGEYRLRLYGLLNAVYLQRNAVLAIFNLCKVMNLKSEREKVDKLKILGIRHKLAAHSINYLDETSQKREAFLLAQGETPDYSCIYENVSQGLYYQKIDLLDELNKYLLHVLRLYDKCYEKLAKTIYATNKDKIAEVMEPINELREKRNGIGIISLPNGKKIKTIPIKNRQELENYRKSHPA